jgi:AhpD family alkylhydroperoxidase
MEARMKHPVFVISEALAALQSVSASVRKSGLDPHTVDLVNLRASQINGCSVCVDMHARDMRTAGESAERIAAVAAWRETPYFTEAERAALALTEAATRLNDRTDPVPDDVWEAAAAQFDESALAGLVLAIGTINIWNRLNATTRAQVGAAW